MYTRVYFNYFIGRFPVQTQAGLGTQPCYEVLGDLWVKYRLGQWACPFNNDPKFAVEVNKSQIKKSEGILSKKKLINYAVVSVFSFNIQNLLF